MNHVASTEKITSQKCKPLPPEILDYVLLNGEVPAGFRPKKRPVTSEDITTALGNPLLFAEVSTSTKKDMIIISLTEYSVLLNEIISVCISEIEVKDSYVLRLKEELK